MIITNLYFPLTDFTSLELNWGYVTGNPTWSSEYRIFIYNNYSYLIVYIPNLAFK